ncbi:YfhO family protein [Flavobacterium sp. CYK-4]|uniref:YfhO family protein n=1 Tax=Flavobacterium lotistagni TaxID=2709660 RepID=UPI001409BCD8|nr:YfhO family protein [Flavobacterium lotistagni]NHM07166.1 YfhO family protein [Flavobacterium lotistagni]
MDFLKKYYAHALFILGFVLVSCIYFYPVLQGKKIFQSDIVQYTGMAKEQNDFRATHHAEPYWTNAAFGGMPTYQLGANYPHEYISKLDHVLRFLPRPADYLFLYFVGFYVLLLVLRTEPLTAFFGALAFGLSTYLIVILGVGHNAKAHAIAYMPLVVAGVLLVYKKRFVVGGILTMIAAALEINANHFQMTYYLLLLLLIISGFFIWNFIKEKQFKTLATAVGVFVLAGILAIGVNATNLMATAEYAKFSTRDKSELTYNPDGTPNTTKNAMSNDYITEYSYGIAESMNVFAPRLFGGSNAENVGTDSAMYEFIVSQNVPEAQAKDFVSAMPTYWGDQPIVAAPAYIGAVIFFLCILAFFVSKRRIRYAFLTAAIISLMLSWGKNFSALTDFCIEYLPMYNKFRAVSSIQVILELCAPVLAILGLQAFLKAEKSQQWKALWQSGAIGLGILGLLFFAKGSFEFAGPSDAYYLQSYGPEFVDALKSDRKSLYSADLLRSGFFIALVSLILWLFYKERVARNTAIILLGLLMVSDLFFVDKNYLSSKDFVSAAQVDVPFEATQADLMIQRDTANYRVFEIDGNLSSARSSYFHKSIGGYHAAKPRRMQQLFDYQIAKNNMNVLDMLNVRYVLQADTSGTVYPRLNQYANGNAWFVQRVKFAQNADQEMKDLDSLDTKNIAVVNQKEFGSMLVHQNFQKDSLAYISLKSYEPNHLKYRSNNSHDGLAVFSEMYYKDGWNAYIDGKKVPHLRVDYALRALPIPSGKHEIEFKFEPQVVKTGSTISLASSVLMLVVIVGGLYAERRKLWFGKPSANNE